MTIVTIYITAVIDLSHIRRAALCVAVLARTCLCSCCWCVCDVLVVIVTDCATAALYRNGVATHCLRKRNCSDIVVTDTAVLTTSTLTQPQ
jgi:hypothetical protein